MYISSQGNDVYIYLFYNPIYFYVLCPVLNVL